ncbi:MAG: hypothetical protein WB615_12465 [Candidatus Tumulicola sp.]
MTVNPKISAHLISRKEHFDWKTFESLVGGSPDIRQVWEAFSFHPQVFNNLKNVLNGLEFGYGYDRRDVHLVFAPHGPSNAYNYNDYIWRTYRIGEALDLRNVKGDLVTSNVFLKPSSSLSGSHDLDDERGSLQDTSIEGLQERGIVFLTCATAVQEQARIVRDAGFAPNGLNATEIAADMLSNLIPNTHLVPSMVATIVILQRVYGYSYLTIDF